MTGDVDRPKLVWAQLTMQPLHYCYFLFNAFTAALVLLRYRGDKVDPILLAAVVDVIQDIIGSALGSLSRS
jgi:hypothetical protein